MCKVNIFLSFSLILEGKGLHVYVNIMDEKTWMLLNARHLKPRRHAKPSFI
jgi:hypothetical protein